MINTENKEYLLNAVLEYCEDIVTVKDLIQLLKLRYSKLSITQLGDIFFFYYILA